MKRIACALLLSMCLQGSQQTITAYVDSQVVIAPSHLCIAEGRASQLFSPAGVQVKWRHSQPPSDALDTRRAVVINIISGQPSDNNPNALAQALPYEGVHVTIYYQRLQETMPEDPQVLLAYVLVHEITHLLQGIAHHSAIGVMKAKWDRKDNSEMQRGRLLLSEQDIALMH